jgi:hypothetical protein
MSEHCRSVGDALYPEGSRWSERKQNPRSNSYDRRKRQSIRAESAEVGKENWRGVIEDYERILGELDPKSVKKGG